MEDRASHELDPRQFPYGVAWYPEWGDAGAWESDLEGMREAGINTVRICEFSWEHIQPEPDRFDFSLYDAVIGRCEELGFGIVMGVDTVRPPDWVFQRHPDIRLLDSLGYPIPGTWPVHCFNHPRFAEISAAYIEAFVPRYKDSPALLYYQVDNEPDHTDHGKAPVQRDPYYCYCENCKRRFRAWLQERYPDGGAPAIRDPFPQPMAMGELSWMEWRLFQDNTLVRRTAWAVRQVKMHDQEHPVTTNIMVTCAFRQATKRAHDPYRLGEPLDVYGMDIYTDVRKDYEVSESLRYALSRQLGGDQGFHCLETQPTTMAIPEGGWMSQQRGFAKYGDDRKLIPWGWRPVAYGARSLVYWVWKLQRPSVWSLARPDGSLTEFTCQTARLAREYAKAWPDISQSSVRPSEVAILNLRDVHHLASHQGLTEVPGDAVTGAFRALWKKRVPVDILDEAGALEALDRYRVVVAPFCCVVTDRLAAALRRYVEDGGVLVWDARSGSYGQRDGRYEERPVASEFCLSYALAPASGLDELFGYRSLGPYADASPALTVKRAFGAVKTDVVLPGETWWDEWEAYPGTEVLGETEAGSPGILRNRAGAGTTLAFAADVFRKYYKEGRGEGLDSVLGWLLEEAGVRAPVRVSGLPEAASEKVEVVVRDLPDGILAFVINASPEACEPRLELPTRSEARDLITGDEFEPNEGRYAVRLEPYSARVLKVKARA